MYLLKLALMVFFCLVMFEQSFGQGAQPGGFNDGWANYDDSDINGLGARKVVFDMTGLRPIDTVPAAGVHPRIFFGPSELQDLKTRLKNTESGRSAAANIHAYTCLLNLGYPGSYDHNANYGMDAFGNRYIDNAGKWNAKPQYDKLISGDPEVWNGLDIKRKHITAALMAFEAFECLIHKGETDPDTGLDYDKRATELAKAMANWAELAINDPQVNPSGNNFNNFGGVHMALAYDFNYNAMTVQQQDLVRMALAKIIPDAPRHGARLPAYANTSNWTTLNSFEIIPNMALEGEAGYKPELTERWMRALHNFYTYGWYSSGAGYEGLGKNYMFITTAIACAKRGYSLLGHPHVKSYAQNYLNAITQPFGHAFNSYDVWGGSGHDAVIGGYKFSASDAVGLKWIFPNDEKVDFMWRNYIEKSHLNDSEGYVYQQIAPDDSYYNYLLPAAIFASDYRVGNWDNQAEAALELDYFAEDRGLAIIRSSTDKNALALQFHARQDLGGHTHGDRNDFTLSALGRVWVRKSYGGSQFQPTWFHSCVLIDGLGVAVGDPDGDKCRQPAKIIDFVSENELSKVAGDATYAYSWEWHWSPQAISQDHPFLGRDGWEPVTETWNDFQYKPRAEEHYDIPFYNFPHWHRPDQFERMVKRPHNPMQKVFRTVGLLKTSQPMVLIVDDLKKDENKHNYTWLAQIARDLTIESNDINLSNDDYRADIILKEPSSTGDRRLLVRVLSNAEYMGSVPPGNIDTLQYFDYFSGNPYNANPNYVRPRLKIESFSVEPLFKILLYPHRKGDALPVTLWNKEKDTLRIQLHSNETFIAFGQNAEGLTDFRLVRDLTSNNKEVQNEIDLKLYPNPAQMHLNVDCTVENAGILRILDAIGHEMLKTELKNSKTTLDLNDFKSGIYFYELRKNNRLISSGELIIE